MSKFTSIRFDESSLSHIRRMAESVPIYMSSFGRFACMLVRMLVEAANCLPSLIFVRRSNGDATQISIARIWVTGRNSSDRRKHLSEAVKMNLQDSDTALKSVLAAHGNEFSTSEVVRKSMILVADLMAIDQAFFHCSITVVQNDGEPCTIYMADVKRKAFGAELPADHNADRPQIINSCGSRAIIKNSVRNVETVANTSKPQNNINDFVKAVDRNEVLA